MVLTRKELNEMVKNIITNILNENRKCTFRFDECTLHTLMEDGSNGMLFEESNPNLEILRKKILRKKNWEINNYDRFLDIIKKTPADKKGFLTWHGLDEIQGDDWVTYTLKGYDVAFALHYIGDGQIDICNLVNNSGQKGIGNSVLEFAKMEGGTQMDNYRGRTKDGEDINGFLGDKYREAGFDRQTWRAEFDPAFQPDDPEWRLDAKYKNPNVEGLELSKHRTKYNQAYSKYKEKFDKRVNPKFNR